MSASNNAPAESAFQALLGVAADTPVMLTGVDVLDWGGLLVFRGTFKDMAGDQSFELRFSDCRELRWRIYVHERADATALVSFALGRDQQRSPAQILTAHFGLSLFYGTIDILKNASFETRLG